MFETIRDEVFPFIKTIGQKDEKDAEGRSAYTHHMKDPLFMMPTAHVLANVVDFVSFAESRNARSTNSRNRSRLRDQVRT